MEHFRWNISQLNFKIGQKTVCGTAVSWFWAKLGVPSDDEKGVGYSISAMSVDTPG